MSVSPVVRNAVHALSSGEHIDLLEIIQGEEPLDFSAIMAHFKGVHLMVISKRLDALIAGGLVRGYVDAGIGGHISYQTTRLAKDLHGKLVEVM